MDQEKLWLIQYTSELEEKLKSNEQKFINEEIRCQLTDALQKSTHTENSILEVKLHNSKLIAESLQKEVQDLTFELSLKSSALTDLSSQLQHLQQSHMQESESLLAENRSLKMLLEKHRSKKAVLKESIKSLQEKVKKVVCNNNEIERKYYSAEFYLNELNKKQEKIEEVYKELQEKKERIKELEEITLNCNSEAQELFDQVCNLTDEQLEQVKKVISGEDLLCASNEKLRIFVEEYEKKWPIILKQSKDYSELIVSNEKTKELLDSVKEELAKTQAENLGFQKELQQIEDLKKKNDYLTVQLTHILNNSSQTEEFSSFSSIKRLISEKSDTGAEFLQLENLINELKKENEALSSRPIIIEEISPSADYSNLIGLELIYQQSASEMLKLRKELNSLNIANQELYEKVQFLSNSESKLREKVKNLLSEKEKLGAELRLKQTFVVEFPKERCDLESLGRCFHSYLEGYKSEIERLSRMNSTLFESLKANKTALFESQEDYKQKLNEILQERSALYSEFQKLKIKNLEQETEIKKLNETFEREIKKIKDSQKVDTKEFAAINELHKCRVTLQEQEQKLLELSSEAQSLRTENKILHDKIAIISQKQQNNELKSKLEDLIQENYILKSNSELLQERIKETLSKNLMLEDQLSKSQKELSDLVINEKIDIGVAENSKILPIIEKFEKKIEELVEENEKKNEKILSLVSFLGNKEGVPEVLKKLVGIIHKIQKSS